MKISNIIAFIAFAIISSISNINAEELPESQKALRQCFDIFRFGDRPKAFEPCKKALALGEMVTNYTLGFLYRDRNELKNSFNHFKTACDDLPYDFIYAPFKNVSCFEVARSYQKGAGVEQNPSKYLEYIEKSCRYENATACAEAGANYENGQINGQNYDLAYYYYKRTEFYADIESLEHHSQVFLGFHTDEELIKFAKERIQEILPKLSARVLPH
ncbi:MAG: sel1 repeat family protein [Helicobacter sp.]|nr:sel1 repeat family protein [Helicobacter sp.]